MFFNTQDGGLEVREGRGGGTLILIDVQIQSLPFFLLHPCSSPTPLGRSLRPTPWPLHPHTTN